MIFRKLQEKDAKVVAQIHVRSILTGFISKLNPVFVEFLYREIAKSKYAFCYVCEDESKVIGFICGGLDTKKLFRELILKKGVFLVIPLLRYIMDFGMPRKIVDNIFYPMKFKDKFPKAEILSVAVSGEAKGTGVGKIIMERAIQEFGRRGITSVKALTDCKNVASNKYYIKSGFDLVSKVKRHDHYLNVYVLEINNKDAEIIDSKKQNCESSVGFFGGNFFRWGTIYNADLIRHIIEVKTGQNIRVSSLYKILLFLLSSKVVRFVLSLFEFILGIILILPIPLYADIIKAAITYLPGTPWFFGNYLRGIYYSRKLKFMGKNVIFDQGVIILYPSNVVIDDFTWIDKNVILGSKSMLIGKRMHVAHNVMITGGGSFKAGNFAGISHSVSIVTSTETPANGWRASGPMAPFFQRRVSEKGVELGKDAFVGIGATILPGVKIEEGAVVGAGSLVKKNVPAWTVVFGVPAKRIGMRDKVKWCEPQ